MKAKNLVRIILLAVIGAAVGSWAMKEFGPSKAFTGTFRPDGVTVINFHGEKRCRTCIGIGNLARKAIDTEFAAGEKAGKVHWETVNYDEPANVHFVKDYSLVSSTVLVTLWKDGKEVKWNRLDAVWDLVGDEAAFKAYIVQNVRELLKQS
jgi:hypothetical protein